MHPTKNGDSITFRFAGLDTLRILASLLVTWQHAASVLGAYETTQWRSISPGQVGVGIFCVISGYLVSQSISHNPEHWLLRRLKTVFPAYWIVTIFAYILQGFRTRPAYSPMT